MHLKEIANEFKAFILKGNVVDLAVGVVIGAAFGKVVDSVVKDLITPLIGMIGGQPDFSQVAIGAHQVVKNGEKVFVAATGKPLLEGGIMIGNFLNVIIAFLILAAVVFFLVVKPMKTLMAMGRKKA